MTMTTAQTTRDWRWYEYIPFLGWMARDIRRNGIENFYYGLVMIVTLLVIAVKTWGLVALGLTAVMTVPFIFVCLILLTVGR